MSVAALDQHTALARLAVEETGRDVFEDKAAKNMFACEHVTHSMAPMKTVGVIARNDIEDIGVRGHSCATPPSPREPPSTASSGSRLRPSRRLAP